MNKTNTLLALALLATAMSIPTDAAARQKPNIKPLSIAPPHAVLQMDDGFVVNDIIDTNFANFDADGEPIEGAVGPAALGCRYNIDFDGLTAWADEHPRYSLNFWSSYAKRDQTYFFTNLFPSQTFTLRASDDNRIKRMTVKIRERDVQPYAGPTYSEGPTEFLDVWPQSAVTSLAWTSDGNFGWYEKRLVLEPPHTRLKPAEVVMHFDLATYGADAKIQIEIEDTAGEISRGAVFVGQHTICPNG